MRYSFLFAILFSCLTSVSSASAETRYSAVIEELPLMEGMTEQLQDALVFDTKDGRILDTFAATTQSRADVSAFYDIALKPLGWMKAGDLVYMREDEILKITFDGNNLVHFSLAPKGN